jgi:6-phospho-3-hexuloisomerase
LKELDYSQVDGMLNSLIKAKREGTKVLVVGAGRSGLVGKAFAMRLMHLGFDVYVMGETITPSIGMNDLIMIISGSGSTALPITIASMAKKLKAFVLAITSHPDSVLGKTADQIMVIPGRVSMAREDEYYSRQLKGEHEPIAPMGTIFEDCCMIFLDAIIIELMLKLEISEEDMRRMHAVIE